METRAPTARLPTSVAEWSKFLALAEKRRLDSGRFAEYAQILYTKHPLPPALIADLLLRPTPYFKDSPDALKRAYLQELKTHRRVNTAAVLAALYKYSTAHTRAQSAALASDAANKEHDGGPQKPRKVVRWTNSYEFEETWLLRLAKAVDQGTEIETSKNVLDVASVLPKWMALYTEAAAAVSRDMFGSIHGLQVKDETERSRNAFILFLFAFSQDQVVLSRLSRPSFKGVCKALSESLERFMPLVMQVSADVAGQLELFRTQTLAKFLPVDKKDAAVSEMNSYMDNLLGLDSFQVPEVPLVNSRAGLYIYLSASLVGRPIIDDVALFTYLHNRYQGDIQSTAVQLILASFDMLANAVFRNEGPKTGHLLKSFVVNKVPLILVSLAASSPMYPFNPEMCITEALGQVDTNVFPTLSGMFEMTNTNSSFHDSVRQDFCFACQLHGLLSQRAIENLLGDITYQSLPDEGRYVKDILVQSCLQDVDRTQKLIGELDNMNGNVGAAAQAVIEVIGSLCRNKETMTLKQLCGQLAGKPLSLDVLLLFDKPQKILHPLCELLDNWGGYEEDQGEYQPVYEEFGSILLLLLVFAYRYGLSPADLGIRSPDSFVGKLLSGGDLCRPLEDLNEQQKSHLNGWIQGLFGSEAAGLGDELMSSCPPQDFYMLVPTLFHQIVLALSARIMTDEMLKGGLEYLVDVLLLPSLVPAILYLSNQLWAGGSQVQGAIIKILQLILRPTSISNEASAMLSSVLNIVARPLEHALRSYQRQDPKCQEVEPLLRAIQENLILSRRTGGADHNELESWTSTPNANITNTAAAAAAAAAASAASAVAVAAANGSPATTTTNTAIVAHGGLAAAVRHTIQSLVQWAQHPPLNGMPATYTHRQTLVALKTLGARRLLAILLDELRSLADTAATSSSSQAVGVAYDVVTAVVCAPDVTNDASLAAGAGGSVSDDNTAGGGGDGGSGGGGPPQQRRITLREALKMEAEDWRRIQKADGVMAETVVRLYRRVEAQMAVPPPSAAAAMLHGDGLGGLGVGGDALGDAIAAAVATGAAGDSVVDAMSLDTAGLDGSGVDLSGLGSATGSAVGGGLDLSGDEIFGGLSGASDFGADFGAWDMDMS
ncbi:mediator complex subunit [Madurella fahalii]|uniref:Mediator of RNA polymerase II transcription subunit 5 n=1 Tax=Madurella fahalii TaxID=1157608 RepID=A0ABQ0G8T3_9PEZI